MITVQTNKHYSQLDDCNIQSTFALRQITPFREDSINFKTSCKQSNKVGGIMEDNISNHSSLHSSRSNSDAYSIQQREKLVKSNSSQAIRIFDRNYISDEISLVQSSKVLNDRSSLKLNNFNENGLCDCVLSDGEMSPVEEVLSQKPIKWESNELKMTTSASSPTLNIADINPQEQFPYNYPNGSQSTKCTKSEFAKNESKEIDLIYHFETFKSKNLNQTHSSHMDEFKNTGEQSTEYNSRFK